MSQAQSQTMVLHRHALSGHSHRVELFLALLGLPCELVDVDLKAGAHKRPEFLRLNPFGQVPVLQDGPVTLSDSNAILVYLARRYGGERWLPQDPVAAAEVQRWLSVAAGPLHKGPASARLVTVFGAKLDHDQAKTVAEGLFQVLDAHLATGAFVAGSEPTIADIALYSYTAHAPEGGVSLEPFGAIRRWLQSIEALPGFVPMAATKVGLLAD